MNRSWLKHLDFELLDLFVIEISFFLAYYLRHRDVLSTTAEWYGQLGLIMFAIQCLVTAFGKNYKNIMQRGYRLEFLSVVKHVTAIEVVFIVYEFIMKEAALLSRFVILFSWGMGIICCYLVRIILKCYIKNRLSSERHHSKMLVMTTNNRVEACMDHILSKKVREYRVTAIAMPIEDKCKTHEEYIGKMDILYGDEAFWEYVRTHVVDEVFIDTFYNTETLEELLRKLLTMGVTIHIGMGFIPDDLPNQFIEKIGKTQAVTTTIKTASAMEIATKRLVDIVGSLIGLILTGIAYIIIAPIIKKASPGPVFFKQERVGRNGRIFNIYKFRSMYLDAEAQMDKLMDQNEMKGLMFKMENDPRIIGSEKGPGKGIGNFIRRTSIDEFPQFWNVLKGDMSLVGTRPPTKKEYEKYELHHKVRLSMKPGLTGMWQTSGRSDITDFEEIVKLDEQYIANWSLGLDVKLICKTIVVVWNRKGSK